jgi:hypothetical protein
VVLLRHPPRVDISIYVVILIAVREIRVIPYVIGIRADAPNARSDAVMGCKRGICFRTPLSILGAMSTANRLAVLTTRFSPSLICQFPSTSVPAEMAGFVPSRSWPGP